MKLGLHIASTTWESGLRRLGPTLVQIVEAAGAAGFDAISVTEHVWGDLLDQLRGLSSMGAQFTASKTV